MSDVNPWKTLSSRLVYENEWIRLREDQVLRPDGQPGIYSVVDTRIATGVVALSQDLSIYLVGQYRYPIQRYSWEIIEGGTEAGETPEQTAVRELREEAGLQAGSLQRLGPDVHLSNCFSSEIAVFFVARDLKAVPSQPDGTEVLQIKKVPLVEALHMVKQGEISDAMSIIAINRAGELL